jgi:hypothetical protein
VGRLDSAQFRNSYKKTVATKTVTATAGAGFRKLKGTVWYLPSLRRVKVFISGVKDPRNKGPNISVTESMPWSGGGGDFAGMRAHLEALLAKTNRRLRDRDSTLREVDVQLARCNVTGMDAATFMDRTCSDCVCWYCEIAGG